MLDCRGRVTAPLAAPWCSMLSAAVLMKLLLPLHVTCRPCENIARRWRLDVPPWFPTVEAFLRHLVGVTWWREQSVSAAPEMCSDRGPPSLGCPSAFLLSHGDLPEVPHVM